MPFESDEVTLPDKGQVLGVVCGLGLASLHVAFNEPGIETQRLVSEQRDRSGRLVSSPFSLLDDFDSPGSLLPLLPGLCSSPASFNFCSWGSANCLFHSDEQYLTNWCESRVYVVLFTSLFLLFKLPFRPVAFVFCLQPRGCTLETKHYISVTAAATEKSWTHPVRVYTSQKHPPWRTASSDAGWIFWCCNRRQLRTHSW